MSSAGEAQLDRINDLVSIGKAEDVVRCDDGYLSPTIRRFDLLIG